MGCREGEGGEEMIRWLKWIIKGKPVLQYSGFNCGCCGKWVNRPFSVREYRSMGRWWDTWGLCDECCGQKEGKIIKKTGGE